MLYAVDNRDDLGDSEGVGSTLKSKVKGLFLQGKVCKQGFQYDTTELFETVTKKNYQKK